MNACHISDTHDTSNDLNKLVPLDIEILFITGDTTYRGSPSELEDLLEQFVELKKRIKYIVCIAGNHELGCEDDPQRWKYEFEKIGVIFLNHESVEIEGIKIFGSPRKPAFFDWVFMYKNEEGVETWSEIPEDTQLLLTYGPPLGILDWCPNGHVGCPDLLDRVRRLSNLKIHLFGHIHELRGVKVIGDIVFSNGSIMDGKYRYVNKPYCFKLKTASKRN
jgi:Icc-related predicted phosphoesterase